MRRWLADLYRYPKRWAIYQSLFWTTWMLVVFLVREVHNGHAITARTIAGAIVSVAIGAVVFGALMYFLRVRQMKRDGL